MTCVFSEDAARLGQFLQLLKTQAILILIFKRKHTITSFTKKSAVRYRATLLLFSLLIVGIHASGISFPLSLLM